MSNATPYKTGRRGRRSSARESRIPTGSSSQGRNNSTCLTLGEATRRVVKLEEALAKARARKEKLELERDQQKQPKVGRPAPTAPAVEPELSATGVVRSGASMIPSKSMGDLPSSTLPLKPIFLKRPSKKLATTGTQYSSVQTVEGGQDHISDQSGIVIDATPKSVLKNRPGYRSEPTPLVARVEASVGGHKDDGVDKPVFRETSKLVGVAQRLTYCERQAARKCPSLVAEDLYWHLRLEFLFEERSAANMRRMKMKAKQFLSLHDLNGLSLEYQYTLVLGTIQAVMDIDPLESKLRQHLKNPEAQEERLKHAKLTTGVVGRAWFGRKFNLPDKSK